MQLITQPTRPSTLYHWKSFILGSHKVIVCVRSLLLMSALIPDRDTLEVSVAREGGHGTCSLEVDGATTTATGRSAASSSGDTKAAGSARGDGRAVTLPPSSFSPSSSVAAAGNEPASGQRSSPLVMENEIRRSWQPAPPSAFTPSSKYIPVVPGDIVDNEKVDGDARKISADDLPPSAPVRVPSSSDVEDDLEVAIARIAAVQARKAELNQKRSKLSGHHKQTASSSASGATNSLEKTAHPLSPLPRGTTASPPSPKDGASESSTTSSGEDTDEDEEAMKSRVAALEALCVSAAPSLSEPSRS